MTKFYVIGIFILSITSLLVGALILTVVPSDAFVLQTELNEDMYVPFFLEGLQEGDSLPHFTATDLDGNTYNTRDFNGQPMLIKFWSPRCPYCRGEIPAVRALYQDLQDEYIFISIVSGVPAHEVQSFVAEQNIPYPVLLDEDEKLRDLLNVKAIPFTYYIDDNAKIENIVIGASNGGSTCASSTQSSDSDECTPDQ